MSLEWIVVAGIAIAGVVIGAIALGNVVALRRELRNGINRPAGVDFPKAVSGADEAGNVFCRGCGSMYDSTQAVCPSCQLPRG